MMLGDWVAKLTENLGFKQCAPCQKRQANLNQLQITVTQKIKDFFITTPPSGPSDSQQ